MKPVRAFEIRYVVIPFYTVFVVPRIYSHAQQGVPGSSTMRFGCSFGNEMALWERVLNNFAKYLLRLSPAEGDLASKLESGLQCLDCLGSSQFSWGRALIYLNNNGCYLMSSNNFPMKRQSRLDRVPQPISLLGRKPSLKNASETLSRNDWQPPTLKSIENNPLSSASLISNMKQQLSSIKLDVEKLISTEQPAESKLAQKMDIFNQSLKEELAHQKKVEEQLRREVRELKLKLSDPKPREQRLAYERKMQELKADKFKSDREKEVFQDRINKLQQELEQATRLTHSKEELKGNKIHQLTRELEKANNQRKRLAIEVAKLEAALDNKAKVSVEEDRDEIRGLRTRLAELEKEKEGLGERVREKEQEMATITEKYQLAMKQTEAKYARSITEFKNLSVQMDRSKQQQYSALNTKIQSLEKELLQLKVENQQLSKQTQQNSRKGKSNETLKQQLSETVNKLQKLRQKFSQQKEQMKQIQQQKQQLQSQNKVLQQQNTVLERKFKNLQGEMKDIGRVEVEAVRVKMAELEANMSGMQKGYEKKLRQAEESIRESSEKEVAEAVKARKEAEVEIMTLKSKIQTAYMEYRRAEIQHQKKEAAQHTEQSKKPHVITIDSFSQTQQIRSSLIQAFVQTTFHQPPKPLSYSNCTQTTKPSPLQSATQTQPIETSTPAPTSNSYQDKQFEQQARRLRVSNLSLQISINQLKAQNLKLSEQLKSVTELSEQKNAYIVELEKQKDIMEGGDMLGDLQQKCRQMSEEQVRMAEDYEIKIMQLENSLEEAKERNQMMRSRANSNCQDTKFDQALKYQLAENQQLKVQLKQKQEEVLQARELADEWRRKADALRSQTEIDKIRGVTQQKSMKSHYEISIQNLKSQLDSQKRKQQTLQRKIDFKVDELKKKDEFIQQVIIGKVGKDDRSSQLDFIRKELEKFFSSNYEARLLNAQQRIRDLEERLSH